MCSCIFVATPFSQPCLVLGFAIPTSIQAIHNEQVAYVAEKPYSEYIMSLTMLNGLFSATYKRRILCLCISHFRLGIRGEYLLSVIATFDEGICDADVKILM
jgi:hypothetical protein